jgi:hypothetical protein
MGLNQAMHLASATLAIDLRTPSGSAAACLHNNANNNNRTLRRVGD